MRYDAQQLLVRAADPRYTRGLLIVVESKTDRALAQCTYINRGPFRVTAYAQHRQGIKLSQIDCLTTIVAT